MAYLIQFFVDSYLPLSGGIGPLPTTFTHLNALILSEVLQANPEFNLLNRETQNGDQAPLTGLIFRGNKLPNCIHNFLKLYTILSGT